MCKNCDKTGTVVVDNAYVARPMSLPCWVCGGTAFKGMTKDQIDWYKQQYKTLQNLLKHAHTKTVDQIAFTNLKNGINKACGRLGVSLIPVRFPKATGIQDQVVLNLKAEFKEYERRLLAIAMAVSQKKKVA